MTYTTCLVKTSVLILPKKLWMEQRWRPPKNVNLWLQISWLHNSYMYFYILHLLVFHHLCIASRMNMVQIKSIYFHSSLALWFISIIYCQYCNVIYVHSYVLYWDIVYVHISVHRSVVLCNKLFRHDMWGRWG